MERDWKANRMISQAIPAPSFRAALAKMARATIAVAMIRAKTMPQKYALRPMRPPLLLISCSLPWPRRCRRTLSRLRSPCPRSTRLYTSALFQP